MKTNFKRLQDLGDKKIDSIDISDAKLREQMNLLSSPSTSDSHEKMRAGVKRAKIMMFLISAGFSIPTAAVIGTRFLYFM